MVQDLKLVIQFTKRDESVDNAIEEHGVITVFESVEQPSIWSQLLVGAFPILLLLGIFFFFMRQMQGGMSGRGGPMAFGKSKAKLMEGGKLLPLSRMLLVVKRLSKMYKSWLIF